MRFLKAIRAVLWSFLGIRKRAGLEDDIQSLSPFLFDWCRDWIVFIVSF